MLTLELNDNLIAAIREKLPPGTNLANMLMDVLYIGREAIYRRLRGEVPFTLYEASVICRKINISLDSVIGSREKGFAVVDVHFAKDQDSLSSYGEMLSYLVHSYTMAGGDNTAQFHLACNALPFMLYMKYDNLSKFLLFKWLYQRNALVPGSGFGDFQVPEEILDLQRQYVTAVRSINHESCLLDYMVFDYLIGDLRYFANIGLLRREDIDLVKGEVSVLIDDLESIAVKGQLPTGKEFQLYISSVNFDATYGLISGDNVRLAFLKVCGVNIVSSTEMKLYEQLKVWIESLRKFSTLISQSGEMQRIMFFNRQRALIEKL